MDNHIYKVLDYMWFIAKDKQQVLEYYHKEYDEFTEPKEIEEETNLQNGFWSAEDMTEELEQKVMNAIEEDLEEDAIPRPQEGDMWFCDNTGNEKSGTVRYWDDEFWVWVTYQEVLDKYKEPVKKAEYLCSTEY